MFIQQQEAFPLEQVLVPACAQMASPQDHAKLARTADLLLHFCKSNVIACCTASVISLAS